MPAAAGAFPRLDGERKCRVDLVARFAHMIRVLAVAAIAGLALVSCDGASDVTTTDAGNTTTSVVMVTPSTGSIATTTTTAPTLAPAGLIFVGGPVVTMNPDIGTVEAIAIDGDMIVAVGSAADIALRVGPNTVVVDLEGRAVGPGFVDAHTHILTDMGGIETGQHLALANGITSLADASVEAEWPERFIAADLSGALRVRTSMYLGRTDNCGVDQGLWYESYEPDAVYSDRLRVAGVKIFADGGSCGPLAVSEPYLEGVDVAAPFHDSETLAAFVGDANDSGYQLAIHAQGDRAIAQAQDALSTVIDGGNNALRHRIDHNVFPTAETISRYGELGIVPVLFGSSEACRAELNWTDFYRELAERPGDIVAANPGLIVAWHGDDPLLTPISPIAELFSLVTRGRVEDDGSICDPPPWMADGGVTVEQGLAMMTTGSAYAIRQDNVVGSLTPGKFADLVVLSDNLLAVPSAAISEVEVLMTMIGGVTEFCARGSGAVCPGWESPILPEASASASRPNHGPELVFDGSEAGEAFWSSGADAPQWIRVDFPQSTVVAALRFTVFQNPPSDTEHQLEVLAAGEWTLVTTFSGFTVTGDVLSWEPSSGPRVIEAFRITTLESLSWPEWYEIEIED